MISDTTIDRPVDDFEYREQEYLKKCKTCNNQRDGISYYCKECYSNQAKRMSGAFHSKDVPSYVKVANEASQEAKTYE